MSNLKYIFKTNKENFEKCRNIINKYYHISINPNFTFNELYTCKIYIYKDYIKLSLFINKNNNEKNISFNYNPTEKLYIVKYLLSRNDISFGNIY